MYKSYNQSNKGFLSRMFGWVGDFFMRFGPMSVLTIGILAFFLLRNTGIIKKLGGFLSDTFAKITRNLFGVAATLNPRQAWKNVDVRHDAEKKLEQIKRDLKATNAKYAQTFRERMKAAKNNDQDGMDVKFEELPKSIADMPAGLIFLTRTKGTRSAVAIPDLFHFCAKARIDFRNYQLIEAALDAMVAEYNVEASVKLPEKEIADRVTVSLFNDYALEITKLIKSERDLNSFVGSFHNTNPVFNTFTKMVLNGAKDSDLVSTPILGGIMGTSFASNPVIPSTTVRSNGAASRLRAYLREGAWTTRAKSKDSWDKTKPMYIDDDLYDIMDDADFDVDFDDDDKYYDFPEIKYGQDICLSEDSDEFYSSLADSIDAADAQESTIQNNDLDFSLFIEEME
jgi:hypothetical protein